MICPIKTDPNWVALERAQPDLAYYLWNKYEGEVPAKYYNLPSNQFQLKDSNLTDVEKNIEELDNFLINFVSSFGVKSEEVKSLQERFGIDALGVTDLINKLILFTEDRQIDTISEEVAHVAVMMMGKSHPAIFELRGKIQDWSEYQKIKDQYLPIYKNEPQVEIEAVGKLISQAIVNNYKVVGIQPNILKKAILAIKEFIKDLFSKTIFVSEKNRLNIIADEIALNILKGNYNYVSNAKPSGRKLNYFEALSENPFAKNIIDTFTDSGAKLTGSLALAGQGDVVYRSIQEPIHDLDFTVYSKSTFDKIKRKLDSVNAIPMHFGWESENRDDICYTYLVPAKGFKITNITRNYLDPSQRVGSFNLVDESGNIVTPTAQNIMPVDFFFEENVEKENKLKNKFFTPSQDIYAGKLSLSSFGKHERMFNRAKDQKDYILSRPTEYSKPSEAFVYYQLPNQIKPGVEELFESNPELANQVYETLEYASTEQVSPAFLYESEIKTPDGKDYLSYAVKIDEQDNKYIANLSKGKQSTDKNIGKLAYYKFIIENKGVGISVDKELSLAGIKVLEQLEKEGYVKKTNAKVINSRKAGAGYDLYVYDKPLYTFTGKIPSSYLTSQQKQQALQQYSAYLDTIFPDSKVKDIVYRGGNLGSKQPQDVEAFTTNKSYAEYRAGQNNTNVYPAVLNIKDSELIEKKETRTLSLDRDDFQYEDYGFTDNKDQTKQLGNFYTVKENNRHILGNKQDIEGFKKFVQGDNSKLDIDIESCNLPS